MDPTITITPFEEQVLQVMGELGDAWVDDESVEFSGRRVCGFSDEWGGPYQERNEVPWRIYPKINLALGRLAKKGLVHRTPHELYLTHGYAAGAWRLTDQGKLLLGIE